MIQIERVAGEGAGSNTFVLWETGTTEAVVIDPARSLKGVMQVADLNGLELKTILLTHGHLNHAVHTGVLANRFDSSVGAHRDELPALQGMTALAGKEGICGVKVPQVRHYLEDGGTVPETKFVISVVATPGYTSGSLSYVVGTQAFVGDALQCREDGRVGIGPSIVRLLQLHPSVQTLQPGHGFSFESQHLLRLIQSRKKTPG